MLRDAHDRLLPRTYLDIGVQLGHSLALALDCTKAVGVDPAPDILVPLSRKTRILDIASDDFFEAAHVLVPDLLPLDMVFIDGMHLFEYALRDFIGAERLAHRSSIVFVHDCMPPSADYANRVRRADQPFWCGDVWKLVPILCRERPDLDLTLIDIPPSGLLMVRRLDPSNRVLQSRYSDLVGSWLTAGYESTDNSLPVTDPGGAVRGFGEPYQQANVEQLARRRMVRRSTRVRVKRVWRAALQAGREFRHR